MTIGIEILRRWATATPTAVSPRKNPVLVVIVVLPRAEGVLGAVAIESAPIATEFAAVAEAPGPSAVASEPVATLRSPNALPPFAASAKAPIAPEPPAVQPVPTHQELSPVAWLFAPIAMAPDLVADDRKPIAMDFSPVAELPAPTAMALLEARLWVPSAVPAGSALLLAPRAVPNELAKLWLPTAVLSLNAKLWAPTAVRGCRSVDADSRAVERRRNRPAAARQLVVA